MFCEGGIECGVKEGQGQHGKPALVHTAPWLILSSKAKWKKQWL